MRLGLLTECHQQAALVCGGKLIKRHSKKCCSCNYERLAVEIRLAVEFDLDSAGNPRIHVETLLSVNDCP